MLKRDVTIQNVHFFDLARVCLVIKFDTKCSGYFDLIWPFSQLHESQKKTNIWAPTMLE